MATGDTVGQVRSLLKVVNRRKREGTDAIVAELNYLLAKAKAGEIRGLCYSAVTPVGCESGYVKVPGCGMHELIGGSTILGEHLLRDMTC
jgi:hypothetical protein